MSKDEQQNRGGYVRTVVSSTLEISPVDMVLMWF